MIGQEGEEWMEAILGSLVRQTSSGFIAGVEVDRTRGEIYASKQ